ncbi:MAG: hypothetical protein IJT50_14080, partial [Lentisphaeria bacterium]|nr:hypothetical protein [Lentisphaeria bacterium]
MSGPIRRKRKSAKRFVVAAVLTFAFLIVWLGARAWPPSCKKKEAPPSSEWRIRFGQTEHWSDVFLGNNYRINAYWLGEELKEGTLSGKDLARIFRKQPHAIEKYLSEPEYERAWGPPPPLPAPDSSISLRSEKDRDRHYSIR